MIEALIGFIIFLLVLGVLYWITTLFPLPYPIPLIIQVVFALILLIAVLHFLLPMAGYHGYSPLYR